MESLRGYRISAHKLRPLERTGLKLERDTQRLREANLGNVCGVRFPASELSTGDKHPGRIDSLGIAETGTPVIIEYKLSSNQAVINRALYYLDWLSAIAASSVATYATSATSGRATWRCAWNALTRSRRPRSWRGWRTTRRRGRPPASRSRGPTSRHQNVTVARLPCVRIEWSWLTGGVP